MKILITGSAGFIGAALAHSLLARGEVVIGVDNHNDYYDLGLKEARLARHANHPNYTHVRSSITDKHNIEQVFDQHRPEIVVNLAAQAGVRYSIDNPSVYIESNIVGFANILEACRTHQVQHLVYASTSSVYGANTKLPYSENQNVDHPLSLYAATKKANELMAHSYSHLYSLPTTGLRFFTVYGPWGRPDMALFKFAHSILIGQHIKIYNNGQHTRDFTYIDDIIQVLLKVLDRPAMPNPRWTGLTPDASTSSAPYQIYNIGSNKPVRLLEYIHALERALGKVAQKEWLPMQPGDVPNTHADITKIQADFCCAPSTTVEKGVERFVQWYREYYQIKNTK